MDRPAEMPSMPQGIPDVTLEVVWGPRQATLDDCAEASMRFLSRLGPFFIGFRDLKLVTTPRKRRVPLGLIGLKEALQTGVNRTDVGHEIIPELGYDIGLTARSSTKPAFDVDIELNIGVYSPSVPNEVSVALGTYDPVSPEQLAAIDWLGLFELAVEVWSPRCGSLLTADVSRRHRLRKALWVGWLTYLNARDFPKPPLPPEVPVKPVRGAGHLIDCLPECFPHHTKKELASLKQVHRSLASRYLDVKSI